MKILLFLLIGLSIVFSCNTSIEESESPPIQYSIAQFMNVTQISGGSFSYDESKILFSSKKTGIYNAYSVSIGGGDPEQLTNSIDNYARVISYFPNDDRFLFTSDKGGNEINHIFLRNTDGTAIDLISDENAKAIFQGWSHDDQSCFISTNSRDPKYFDLYEVDVTKSVDDVEGEYFAKTMIFQNSGYGIGPMSPNKNHMALTKPITTDNGELYIYDRTSSETKLISEHQGNATYNPEYFSLNSKTLFYLTNEDKEFRYLVKYNLETEEKNIVEEADWDIVFAGRSKYGKYRYVGINADAKTKIIVYDSNNQMIDLPEIPNGEVTSVRISHSEKLMLFYVNSSISPNSLYVYNFETKEYTQLMETMNPEINQDHLVSGEVIRFKSFDGLEIPAILYKPRGIQAGELRPAILDIHGGPGGQRRLNYQFRVQYLVNHGYVVLSVNNRGSSGYGKTFYAADNKNHGDVDLKDCIWSKRFLESTGYVDPEKIGIMGGSYGGYLVMAALTFAPEEFKVGVNYYGVTNWLRTLKSIPPWWESFKEALYDEIGNPFEDSVALYNKSPLFHAGKITKPFIVLQGANDPRVLKVESDEIVKKARRNGVYVDYVLFEDEGHGFQKVENQIEATEKVHMFLDKYLWEKEIE